MSWEVRTMRSATSYFNFTLLRKNFARFWPIWSLYGLFWLAVLPLNILSNRIHWDGGMARSLPLNYLDGGPSAAVALTALFGLLCAMAVFSYLYASRSVGMLHALPLRREGLFLTNLLSGLVMMAIPYAVTGVLTVLVFYFFRGRVWWCLAGQLLALYWLNVEMLGGLMYPVQLFGVSFEICQQGFALLALVPIWLYRGRQGYHSRWFQYFCYAFYPVHMLVLALALQFLNR